MEVFNKHLPSYEITLARSTYGKQQWEAMYNYPLTGVTYWTTKLGDPETLGNAHAIMPFISFPIQRWSKGSFNFRLSAGLGYLTNKFDRIHNYKYIAIGSHVNAALNLRFEYRWYPVDHLQLLADFQLMHFSNGSTKTPNYGINIPSFGIGAAYKINKENPYIRRMVKPTLTMYEFDGRKFLELKIGGVAGIKDIGEANNKRYFVSAAYINLSAKINDKSNAGLCLDLSFDGSDARLVGVKGVDYTHDYQLIKPGMSLMYEIFLSRLSIPLGLGFYFPNQTKSEGLSYYKLGLQYMIYNNLYANVTLKTHYAKADYVAFGMGYKFRIRHYLLKS